MSYQKPYLQIVSEVVIQRMVHLTPLSHDALIQDFENIFYPLFFFIICIMV